jgi:hypothetical protein
VNGDRTVNIDREDEAVEPPQFVQIATAISTFPVPGPMGNIQVSQVQLILALDEDGGVWAFHEEPSQIAPDVTRSWWKRLADEREA